ncbi:hypothetical protein [Candidatus Ruthia endofausta]
MKPNDNQGKIIIHYQSIDELDNIPNYIN